MDEYTKGFKAGQLALIAEIEETFSKGNYFINIQAINPLILNDLKAKYLDFPGPKKYTQKIGSIEPGVL